MTTRNSERLERRRDDLRAFLRSRRERLTPRDVGLPQAGRRRTPGLRREEVATLAGIGLTWYTWLEQGRDITVTTQILDAVAVALRLDSGEQAHLYRLAGHTPADTPSARRTTSAEEPASATASRTGEVVPPHLARVVEEWAPNPAYVLDRHWRVRAANSTVRHLFGELGPAPSCLDGFLREDAAPGEPRRSLANWEQLAPSLVAGLRADAARYPHDPEFARIVDRLSQHSEEFATLWSLQEVGDASWGVKEIAHPSGGPLLFDRTTMRLSDDHGLRLTLLTPRPGTDTHARLSVLLPRTLPEPARLR